MDHLTKPLDELHARAGQFLLDPQATILYVPCEDSLFDGAHQLLASLEWHPENRHPFFELLVPYEPKSAGWSERVETLRQAYQLHVDAYDGEAVTLPELPPVDQQITPLEAFGRQLGAVVRVFTSDELGTRGALVMLAPEKVKGRERLAAELAILAPLLDRVRWIWLDRFAPGESVVPDAGHVVPKDAWVVPCAVDPAAQQQETDQMLAGMIAGLGRAGGPSGARPPVAPPPHPSDPPSGQADVSPPEQTAMVHALLRAVQALRAGKTADALPLLREARDAALAGSRTAEGAEMEILLATLGTLVAAGERLPSRPTFSVFESAAKRAEGAGLTGLAAKSLFLLGVSANLSKDLETAGSAFARAANLAKQAGAHVLQFHALRMAGELAVGAGLDKRAAALWGEALDVARSAAPAEMVATGLADGVRDVEALCRAHGIDHSGDKREEPARASEVAR